MLFCDYFKGESRIFFLICLFLVFALHIMWFTDVSDVPTERKDAKTRRRGSTAAANLKLWILDIVMGIRSKMSQIRCWRRLRYVQRKSKMLKSICHFCHICHSPLFIGVSGVTDEWQMWQMKADMQVSREICNVLRVKWKDSRSTPQFFYPCCVKFLHPRCKNFIRCL